MAVRPAPPDLGDSCWGLAGGGPFSAQHLGEQLRGAGPHRRPQMGFPVSSVSRAHLTHVGEPPGLSPAALGFLPPTPPPSHASAHQLPPSCAIRLSPLASVCVSISQGLSSLVLCRQPQLCGHQAPRSAPERASDMARLVQALPLCSRHTRLEPHLSGWEDQLSEGHRCGRGPPPAARRPF